MHGYRSGLRGLLVFSTAVGGVWDSTLCDQQIVVLSLGVPCIRFNYVSKGPTEDTFIK